MRGFQKRGMRVGGIPVNDPGNDTQIAAKCAEVGVRNLKANDKLTILILFLFDFVFTSAKGMAISMSWEKVRVRFG